MLLFIISCGLTKKRTVFFFKFCLHIHLLLTHRSLRLVHHTIHQRKYCVFLLLLTRLFHSFFSSSDIVSCTRRTRWLTTDEFIFFRTKCRWMFVVVAYSLRTIFAAAMNYIRISRIFCFPRLLVFFLSFLLCLLLLLLILFLPSLPLDQINRCAWIFNDWWTSRQCEAMFSFFFPTCCCSFGSVLVVVACIADKKWRVFVPCRRAAVGTWNIRYICILGACYFSALSELAQWTRPSNLSFKLCLFGLRNSLIWCLYICFMFVYEQHKTYSSIHK